MDSVFNLNVLGINNVAYSKCEALRMIGIVIRILKNRIRNTLSGVVKKLMNM